MKALSIRQPWAWLIANGHKPIENRTWRTEFRGNFQIHAAKGLTVEEYKTALEFVRQTAPLVTVPDFDQLKRGGIIGLAEVVDCVSQSRNSWFVGPFGFVLANPYPLPFVPCWGELGFFDPNLSPNDPN